MNSVFFLVLRRMRAPLIVLVVIYAISVLGLTLVPGVDAEGKTAPPLSFFHAFYFISYTATTIGFGEIPTAFSEAQRLWVTVCIYLTVIGWSYSIVTLLALLQDDSFKSVLVKLRFARRVRAMREPFHLLCGCGETGSLVCHTLDRLDQRFVVVERSAERVQALDLQDFRSDAPALAGDARQAEVLQLAGLAHPLCQGVLALTDDEEVNLAVAVAARLISPHLPVLARADSPTIAANMASFGVQHVLNPFAEFADALAMGIHAPHLSRLNQLLTGIPGEVLAESHVPPAGAWVVAGYGRLGHEVVRELVGEGMPVRVLDPEARAPELQVLPRTGVDAESLQLAGIESARGLVAGTPSDINNLAIAMTARQLNPTLFIAVRQNHSSNAPLFDAFGADLTLVPSREVAQRCLAWLTTPLLPSFLQLAREQSTRWVAELEASLASLCEGCIPLTWSVVLDEGSAPAVCADLRRGERISLGALLGEGGAGEAGLAVRCLLLARGGERQLLPGLEQSLAVGDALLLSGQISARAGLRLRLLNANTLAYVLGRERPGGWLWQRWANHS